ncbi:KAP family P-loop NTPase fold protein, partial [Azonexus hydrophilus]|uniref:KAP family P-loop NTPase fold protein n=1 Tax=Azonexus hydrophilus TaxID=418702 RepID=UPI0024924119
MARILIHNDETTLKDQLCRSALRLEFGNAIASCKPPHVFGMHGEWGSGKTSFLRQLRYELDAIKDSEASEELQSNRFSNQIVTVWFEAWRYQAEPLPVVALLHEIRRQLEQRSLLKRATAEAKKLAEISLRSVMNSFDDVAKLLKLESISSKGIQATGETWEKDHLQTKLGTDTIREFLEHAVNNLLLWKARDSAEGKARLVVFVDDLDRCQPATAFKLLEALKVHLSLPNCIFVLGMNQQTVVEAIASELKRDEKDAAPRLKAEAYLEKLCTNVWRLPLPDQKNNLTFFTSLLSDLSLQEKLRKVLVTCRCLPPNPRRLKALANIVNRLWENLPEEERNTKHIELATLFYAYVYQFHGDLFRRWQWDFDYLERMKEFANSSGNIDETDKAAGFDGLILPQRFGEEDSPISNYP